MLGHPWLNMASNYDSRVTPEELQQQLAQEAAQGQEE